MGPLGGRLERSTGGWENLNPARSKFSCRMNPDFMLMDIEKSGRQVFKVSCPG